MSSSVHESVTFERVRTAQSNGNIGFCIGCGNEQDGVEPDARSDRCESCGLNEVYGAEELMLEEMFHGG